MNKNSDKFIDDIKQLLEKPPFFEPDERMISAMKHRLDNHDQVPQRKKFFWWWLLLIPLFTVPLLFSTFHFFNKSESTQQEVITLKQQLTLLRLSTDSATQHLTTVYYDTVYQTVYKTEVILEDSRNTSNLDRVYSNYPTAFPYQNLIHFPIRFFPSSWQGINGFQNKWNLTPSAIVDKAKVKNSLSPILASLQGALAPLPVLPISPLSESSDHFLEGRYPTKIYEDSGINPWLYFVPTGINAGVQVMPALSVGIPGEIGLGLAYGVTGELCFRKNLHLGVGLNKLNFNYSVNGNYENYPAVNPENPQDFINELSISLNYLDIPVHFRYLFRTSKKIQPFVNLGLLSRRSLSQTYDFELSGPTSNEYQRRVVIPGNSFNVTGFQGGLGIEYPIKNKFNAKVQLLYKHDLNLPNQEYVKTNYLGLDLGLFYQFK